MKKNFLINTLFLSFVLFNFCLINTIQLNKAEALTLIQEDVSMQLYVHQIKFDNSTYNVGSDVSGVFTLSNTSSVSLQDFYYTVSIEGSDDGVLIDESVKSPISYIKEDSKREIGFRYGLPKSVSGDNKLIINVYLLDGTLVASGYQTIYIQGEPQFKNIKPLDVVILKNDIAYEKDYGLILESGDVLSTTFNLRSNTSISASVGVFQKDSPDVVDSREVVLKDGDKNGKYTLNIPTEKLSPGKYEARIEFKASSSDVSISPIKKDFIMNGLISNVKMITSDKFSVAKNEKFNLNVSYEGYGETEDSSINEKMYGSTIDIVIRNENDIEIFSISSPIDLSKYDGQVSVPVKAGDSAEYLNISAEIKDGLGAVIDSYSSTLPSQMEVSEMYPEKENNLLYTILGILLLIVIIIAIYLIRKGGSKVRRKMSIAVIAFVVMFLSTFNSASAFSSVDVLSGGGYNLSSFSGLSIVSSPLPGSVSNYSAGDTFSVGFNFKNPGRQPMNMYYLLPPDQNSWSDWSLPDISVEKMIPSRTLSVISDKKYRVPNTSGVYNFTFYVASKINSYDCMDIRGNNRSACESAKKTIIGSYVIKKIVQPITVEASYAVNYNGSSQPITTTQAVSCNNDHTEGERVCDDGTPGVWNCESTLGACTLGSVPVAGGVIVSGGKTVSGTKIGVKSSIPSVVKGNKFYIVTDLLNSDWVDKEYAYTEFVYGTAKTNTYQPYSRKSNVHTISYDGVDTVVATSQYVGKESKFTNARVTIKEVGSLVAPTVCRNIPESEVKRMFNTPNNLSSVPICSSPRYTLFSNGLNSYSLSARTSGGNNSRGSTASLSLNVCSYLTSNNGDSFYVLIDSNGTSWVSTRYDMFLFTKGIPKSLTFSSPSKKYNVISGSYDGGCTVKFSSGHAGKKSDYTVAQMKIIELGPWNSNMCYYSGLSYPSNFNRGAKLPALSQCQDSNVMTCATGNAEWRLNQGGGVCSSFLSCVFKNSKNENVYSISVEESFSYDASFATSGNSSILSYLWDFKNGDPSASSVKSGNLKYGTPGEKQIDLKVLLNGTVLEQTQCPAINVTCPSGDCGGFSAGCGVSEVEDGQGLGASSPNLCLAGQISSDFSEKTNIRDVWAWNCKSSTGSASCTASCKSGLTYCESTKTCSSSCDGDICPGVKGIQGEDNPISTVLNCQRPKLKMKVTFDKPYADENTSKCSMSWNPITDPEKSRNYTKCKLDGVDTDNSVLGKKVIVGKHNLSCITKVEDPENSSVSLSSDPFNVSFTCSRVPKSTEN